MATDVDIPEPDRDRETGDRVDPDSDAGVLARLNRRFIYAAAAKAKIIEEGDKDIRYTSGNTWDEADKKLRGDRPKLNLDQLSQYLNQLVNSYRQNPRAAKLAPSGEGATKELAELRANRIRQIEHDSHAQEVYTVAGEQAATRGYGYARIVAEYEAPGSPNQVLRLKAIPNPNQVLEDPDGESTSGADWQYLFFFHSVAIEDFPTLYPHAAIKTFDTSTISLAPKFFERVGRIIICEYWEVRETPAPNGIGKPTRTVCQYLTNGVELLHEPGKPKKTEWKGSSIPFAACYGKIVYSAEGDGDSEKMLMSFVRLARDAAKAYNWTASTEMEALGLPVKSALFAYEGQLDQEQIDLVEQATREPVALITAKATIEELPGQVLPLPQYGMRAPDISGYEIARESFRRDIQNALGRYSVQDQRRGNTKVTSGVALQELGKSGDLGSYHFTAHYDDFVRELAHKLNELLPHYDDSEKEISVRLPDETTKRITINKPTGRAPDGTPTYKPTDPRMDVGQFTVTISTGPSFDSQRERAKDAAMTLLQNPQAFPVVGADSVRLMDLGPIGDQMAKDLEFLQPAPMQQARQQEQAEGGPPDPRVLMQQLAQLKQQLAHAEQVMQQQHAEMQGKQAELDHKERIEQAKIASNERIADVESRRRAETAIAVAEINSKAKDAALFMEERARIGVQEADAAAQALDHAEAQRARQHQAAMAAAGAGGQADEAQAEREHAAAMGEQAHQQTLEQTQQAAALAPPSDNGAGA